MPESAEPYRLVVSSAATRALEQRIPAKVVFAIYELMTGPLFSQPYRLGKPLTTPFEGLMSAQKGSYRIVYRIIEDDHCVYVVAIDHRADIYRM